MKTQGQDTPALGYGTSVVSLVCAGDNGRIMLLDEERPESESLVLQVSSGLDYILLTVNPRIRVS